MTTSDYSTRTTVLLDTVHEHDHEHEHDNNHENYIRPMVSDRREKRGIFRSRRYFFS